jgi:hypothetical protein
MAMKKIFTMLAAALVAGQALSFTMGSRSADAMSTEQRYHESRIVMSTVHDNTPFYAEPNKGALTLGFYPKGTLFVPINQSRNLEEAKTYNLVIRFDGAVGWVSSDDVVLSKR